MTPSRAWLAALCATTAVACSAARPRAPQPIALRPARPSHARPAEHAASPEPRAPWTLLAPRELPSPLGDVAALANHEAIVIASDRLYRWGGGRATPVCDRFDPPPTMLRADGDRFIAFGASDDGEAYVWHSDDRGARCDRAHLPGMFVANVPQTAAFGVTLDGTLALAWNPNGAVLRSDDGGAHWARLPDLPGVAGVWRLGATRLIAAAHTGRAAQRNGDEARVRLASLGSDAGASWQAVDSGRDRRLPMDVRATPDGGALLADGLGVGSLAPDARFAQGPTVAAYHDGAASPAIVVPAGPGRFVALGERTLDAVDAQGAHPFAALPAGASPRNTSLDAAADGDVWLATRSRLYHGAVGQPLAPATSSPLGDGAPRRIAASGPHIALLGADATVARSDDEGAHWRASHAPESLGEPLAMSVAPSGAVLVLGVNGLGVNDGDAFVEVPLPSRPTDAITQPVVQTAGDRWIVVQGAVLTSDDEGAHWQRRALDAGGSVDAVAVAAVFRGASGLVLDAANRVYRTDDAASTFALLGVAEGASPSALPGVMLPTSPGRIAWDGGRRIAVFSRERLLRSNDGGATWHPSDRGRPYELVDATFAPDGRLVGMLRTSACDATSSGEPGAVVAFEPWEPSRSAACDHPAAAWTFDEGSVLIATETASVWRGDLARLEPSR